MQIKNYKNTRLSFFVLPGMFWFFTFLVIPIFIVIALSFLKKGTYGGVVFDFNLDNYLRTLNPLYLKIIWNSLKLATLTTVSCLLLAFPVAYTLATVSVKWRALLLLLVVIPFWTNFIIRVYAIKVLLSMNGPISHLLFAFGIRSELSPLTENAYAVWFAMVLNYLPFMVLPLYVSLEKFDFSLVEAAQDLGASTFSTLKNIVLPLIRPGLVSGFILVFIPSLGEFVIPDMIGGAKTMLIGNLITDQFLKVRDWPFGAALSMCLLLTVGIGFWIQSRLEKSEVRS